MRITELINSEDNREMSKAEYEHLRSKAYLCRAAYDENDGWDTLLLDKVSDSTARAKLNLRWRLEKYEKKHGVGLIREIESHLCEKLFVKDHDWPKELLKYKGVADCFQVAYLMDKFSIERQSLHIDINWAWTSNLVTFGFFCLAQTYVHWNQVRQDVRMSRIKILRILLSGNSCFKLFMQIILLAC